MRVVVDATPELVPDDRADLQPGDSSLLVVEDDPHYARVLADLARDQGFKVLDRLHAAPRRWSWPASSSPRAVSLDVFLPDMLGWTVLSHLKQDVSLRHIPVQIVTLDENRQHGLSRGAFSFVTKPATTEGLASAIEKLQGVHHAAAQEAAHRRGQRRRADQHPGAARPRRHRHRHRRHRRARRWRSCEQERVDCMVLDLRLPDISGFEVLSRHPRPTGPCRTSRWWSSPASELTPDEDRQLQELARKVVLKGVESPERLLDETAIFLHRVVSDLPPHKQQMLEKLHRSDEDLRGRKVLVVDDDVRNIFALGSVLERHGMDVAHRPDRARGHLAARDDARHRGGADGHHDARDGRLPDHPAHPAATRRSGACPSWRSPPRR